MAAPALAPAGRLPAVEAVVEVGTLVAAVGSKLVELQSVVVVVGKSESAALLERKSSEVV